MITIQVVKADGRVAASEVCEHEVKLVLEHYTYEDGDRIEFDFDKVDSYYVLCADDVLGEALVYVKGKVSFFVPFGEKKLCYSPKLFAGESHLMYAREAEVWEYEAYRNLALNVMDQHENTGCFPHASANVETRGESVFAARNAIDGVTANHSHGYWPYASWGINRDPEAAIKVDFGRVVTIDRAKLYTRADFPHDSWWTEATLEFSDGSSESFKLEKTDQGQMLEFSQRTVTWVRLGQLIKADDPSPFPALTQLEVFGR